MAFSRLIPPVRSVSMLVAIRHCTGRDQAVGARLVATRPSCRVAEHPATLRLAVSRRFGSERVWV